MSNRELFSEFQEVSAKQWKQKIQVDLKGADYNETLVWESPEGIKVKPFYHTDDEVSMVQNERKNGTWKIGFNIDASNALTANKRALNMLQRGVESLRFTIPSEETKIATLLEGIDIKIVPIHLNMAFLSRKYLNEVVEFYGSSLENVSFHIDPVGQLAKTGNWFDNWNKDFEFLKDTLTGSAANVLSVNLALYQNAGGNMVQQLAYGLAHANEYLNAFINTNDDPHPKCLTFTVSIGTSYFFEIAKLRALRRLWDALIEAYPTDVKMHIIASPTRRNKTLYDYNTNMLRTTTECMAAILGGADEVMNIPYDAIYHKNNEFSDRIALNQLLLLKNESYFDKVQNAADGAYFIDTITSQLAEKALILFKSIEKGGGFLKQLKAHTVQRKISESAQKEQREFENGTEVLVGTNKYRNQNDKMKDEIELYPFLKTNPRKTLVQPILEKRLAESIEQKRLDDE